MPDAPGRDPHVRPPRVRITADDGVPDESSSTQGIALPGAPVHEADAVFLTGLIRAQLRLAAGILVGFVMVSAVLTGAIFVVARTGDPLFAGVPLSWLLQSYGYYPLILIFAVLFARGATRNERRFRALAETEREAL